jgi:8-oxo-dGTP pyrophosphatase MutT (NUDIX family)
MSEPVRAAGGVPYRSVDSRVEVLVVHRPEYDDWSFPKGKCHDGELDDDCVQREIGEETGLEVELERFLGESWYRDAKDRPKVARFWSLRPVGGEAVAQAEIDGVEWLEPDDARKRLSYDRDREILDAFLAG